MAEITIQNAPWWLNHSHVTLKGLMLAEDEAAIQNSMVSVTPGEGGSAAAITTRAGSQSILTVERMVKHGHVAVMLRGGAKYEVDIPAETGQLLAMDIAYIAAQITAMSKPMSAQEQADFLASANGHVEGSLVVVK